MMRLSHATDARPSLGPLARVLFALSLDGLPAFHTENPLSSLLCPAVRPVRSFVETSLPRPVPPFHLLRFFLSIGPGLVMHLNNLFISDSTLQATRPLVIMRGKHSPRRENVSGDFCFASGGAAAGFDVSFTRLLEHVR